MSFDFSSIVVGTPDPDNVRKRGGGGGGRTSEFLDGIRSLLDDCEIGQGLTNINPFELVGLDPDNPGVDREGNPMTQEKVVNRISSRLRRDGALDYKIKITTNLDDTVNVVRGPDLSDIAETSETE